MIIFGIDPGLNKTGVGILQLEGKNLGYIKHDVIKTDPKQSLVKRLQSIVDGVHSLVTEYRPAYAAVEDIFYSVNIKSAILLGETRGAIISTLLSNKVDLFEFSALQIKKAVVGYGKADKEQVRKMVEILLKIDLSGVASDASDALACAICLAFQLTCYEKGIVYDCKIKR
ncbi:MAG: crossover junction endodeoxyribonuclease RuvC [Calditerrivibrio sp.]|nr:crossover junction endodeoxyribonuclease RuvC [Calditerrivibrio sp.]